jgi:hypothetical protein
MNPKYLRIIAPKGSGVPFALGKLLLAVKYITRRPPTDDTCKPQSISKLTKFIKLHIRYTGYSLWHYHNYKMGMGSQLLRVIYWLTPLLQCSLIARLPIERLPSLKSLQ